MTSLEALHDVIQRLCFYLTTTIQRIHATTGCLVFHITSLVYYLFYIIDVIRTVHLSTTVERQLGTGLHYIPQPID